MTLESNGLPDETFESMVFCTSDMSHIHEINFGKLMVNRGGLVLKLELELFYIDIEHHSQLAVPTSHPVRKNTNRAGRFSVFLLKWRSRLAGVASRPPTR